jgi:putative spermidine/putrescine transport system permease protein
MLVVYLGSLCLLLVTAFWRLNPLTSEVEHVWTLDNFETILTEPVYRTITLRTLGMALAVTVADIALALPLAYYIARMVGPRARALLLMAVVVPLWTSYLVRVFAWKTILGGRGPAEALLSLVGIRPTGLGASSWAVWITFCYLWMPYVILPIEAALERVPNSLLEASSDLGARGWTTFRKVVWPLAFPGVVAASIFAFSLTLGDYITPTLVGKGIFIGNTIYSYVGTANNLPLAAAFAFVPILIVAIYMAIARKAGAFEAM